MGVRIVLIHIRPKRWDFRKMKISGFNFVRFLLKNQKKASQRKVSR